VYFIKGTEEETDKFSALRDDTKDTDHCSKEPSYKITKDYSCILDENIDFEEKT
jgi:hypothetical protein